MGGFLEPDGIRNRRRARDPLDAAAGAAQVIPRDLLLVAAALMFLLTNGAYDVVS